MISKKLHVQVLTAGADAALTLQAIVQAYTNYKTVAEEEQTKRDGIAAWEKTTIEKVRLERDVLLKYLEKSFDERARNFSFLFEKVDAAIAEGDNYQLAVFLHSITELAKSNPFKDFADLKSVTAALDDPNHEWVI